MIGKVVSQYKGLEKRRGGDMRVLSKAEDTQLKRTAALKFLPPHCTQDPEARGPFVHEAQAASALEYAIKRKRIHPVILSKV